MLLQNTSTVYSLFRSFRYVGCSANGGGSLSLQALVGTVVVRRRRSADGEHRDEVEVFLVLVADVVDAEGLAAQARLGAVAPEKFGGFETGPWIRYEDCGVYAGTLRPVRSFWTNRVTVHVVRRPAKFLGKYLSWNKQK